MLGGQELSLQQISSWCLPLAWERLCKTPGDAQIKCRWLPGAGNSSLVKSKTQPSLSPHRLLCLRKVQRSSLASLLHRSSENQLTMHKCFFFLVFMVIILPSLGLSRYRPPCHAAACSPAAGIAPGPLASCKPAPKGYGLTAAETNLSLERKTLAVWPCGAAPRKLLRGMEQLARLAQWWLCPAWGQPAADPERTRSGISVAPATAILTVREVSTHAAVVLCGRRGCSGSVGSRGSHPPGSEESMHPLRAPPSCSAALHLSEMLLFFPLQPGPFFPLALRHPLSGRGQYQVPVSSRELPGKWEHPTPAPSSSHGPLPEHPLTLCVPGAGAFSSQTTALSSSTT